MQAISVAGILCLTMMVHVAMATEVERKGPTADFPIEDADKQTLPEQRLTTPSGQLTPEFERQQELQHKFNPPPVPILVSPEDGTRMTSDPTKIAPITFRWKAGGDSFASSPDDTFTICIFAADAECGEPNGQVYTGIPGNQYQYALSRGLPERFANTAMKWSVAACRSGDCRYAEPWRLSWFEVTVIEPHRPISPWPPRE